MSRREREEVGVNERERVIETKIILEIGREVMEDWENLCNRITLKVRERER